MEFIFEIIFQFLGEMLLQMVFELLAEFGFRSLSDPFKRPRNPILSSIGFVLWGAIAGGISLLIFPASPIANPTLRKINLLATPLVIATIMMFIGRWRDRRGQDLVKLDTFGYAFVFAFFMSLVRFIWAA